jgi:hypothetical protein
MKTEVVCMDYCSAGKIWVACERWLAQNSISSVVHIGTWRKQLTKGLVQNLVATRTVSEIAFGAIERHIMLQAAVNLVLLRPRGLNSPLKACRSNVHEKTSCLDIWLYLSAWVLECPETVCREHDEHMHNETERVLHRFSVSPFSNLLPFFTHSACTWNFPYSA